MPTRLAAACVSAVALLCACTGPKSAATSTDSAASPPPSVSPAAAAAVAPTNGPANALVSDAGKPGAVPVDDARRRALAAIAAKVPAALRPRLRYALAAGEDGKTHLVVYDGEGLGREGRHPGKPHEYVVFRVLNEPGNQHYDPQQNALIAPLPPPRAREKSEPVIVR